MIHSFYLIKYLISIINPWPHMALPTHILTFDNNALYLLQIWLPFLYSRVQILLFSQPLPSTLYHSLDVGICLDPLCEWGLQIRTREVLWPTNSFLPIQAWKYLNHISLILTDQREYLVQDLHKRWKFPTLNLPHNPFWWVKCFQV